MYNPGVQHYGQDVQSQPHKRILASLRVHATPANLVGLIGGILVLFCLFALPVQTSLRVLLYLTVIIATLLRPRLALYLTPIAVPWGSLDAIDVGGASLNSADILVFLLAASWLLSYPLGQLVAKKGSRIGALDRDDYKVVPPYLIAAMLALLFAMLFSMTVAISLSLSIKEIAKWIELAMLLLLGTQYLRTRRQIWAIVIILCLAAISQALLGYVQAYFSLGPESFVRGAGLRVYGTFNQPNPYAGYINMTLTMAIALALLGRNVMMRILAGITALLLAIALYLSQSRGADIAIAVALLFIVTVGIPRLRVIVAAGAIAAMSVLGAYLAGLIPQHYLLPILKQLGLAGISLAAPDPADYSTAERLAHWIAGVNMFRAHPLFGVGIGNYPAAYPQYFVTIFVLPLGHAHNYYINIAAETGLFGFTAFTLFLLAIFIAGSHSFRVISKKCQQLQTQQAMQSQEISPVTSRKAALQELLNDRALAIGLLAALLSVCVHNLVDNLYVHSMTNLFVLLLIMLIRLKGVTPHVGSNGGRFDSR